MNHVRNHYDIIFRVGRKEISNVMKKLFILTLIILSSFVFITTKAFAKEEATQAAEIIQVEYELPYPGILPDNPLYYLKAIRDNLLKFFITDPLRKTEFDLLQSDKRLGAAKMLLAKGKNELSITTLSKSGNYFDDAISQIQIARKQGKDIKPLLDNLLNSSKKHQQVISEMEKNQKDDVLLNLKFLHQRAKDFQERVEIIKADL